MYSNRAQFETGRRIREIRREQEATQQQFSENIYITPNFLSEIENGKKGLSCETLYNICESQKVSADYLLFGNAKENKNNRPARGYDSNNCKCRSYNFRERAVFPIYITPQYSL